MRWKTSILLAAALMLPLAACETEGEEAGEAEIEIESPDVPEPDIIVEDREPDVIVDERDEEGVDADINIDEEGNVSGGVEIKDREPDR